MPRLSKALRILNIGVDTAVAFLKAEFNVCPSSINSMITEEEYSALMSKFNYDKVLHGIIQKKISSRRVKKRKRNSPAIVLTDVENMVLERVAVSELISKERISKNKKNKTKSLSLFKEHIKNNKGRCIRYPFRCAVCGHTHYSGYLYTMGEVHKEICRYCISKLTGKGKGTKLIYTPM